MKNLWRRLFYRPFWCLATLFVAILFVITLVGEPIAQSYRGWINSYLGIQEAIKVDDSNNETPDVMYYMPEYFMQYRWQWDSTANKGKGGYVLETRWNEEGLYTYLKDVIKRTDAEGSVLLKNEHSALPYAEGTKVSMYGISQFANKYLVTGEGSGAHAANTSDTLKGCLTADGIEVNAELYDAYEIAAQGYAAKMFNTFPNGDLNYVEFAVNEAPFKDISSVSDSTTGDGKSDSALYIISRLGAENGDTNFSANGHVGNNYLDLTKEEIEILDKLTDYKKAGKIDSIVLVLNTCNAMQFKTLAKYTDVDSILWVGTGGTSSFAALADVLSGKADPNGRLADTYVYDNYSAPSTVNTGDFTYSDNSGVPATETYAHSTKYVVYQEGIYVGYKYYETRYEDMVLNQGNATGTFGVKNSTSDWKYNEEVIYPFGYGGSYATFERSDFKVKEKNGTFTATIKIKNTSKTYSGKDVFELYIQKPYTDYDKQNGIEKSAVELIGFAKTETLAPGESQTLEITVDKRDLASYDSNDKGTYILEAGSYYFAYGSDSHDALNNILARKGAVNSDLQDSAGDKGMSWVYQQKEDDFTTYATSKTGVAIENQFDDVDLNRYANSTDQKITYLSRANWKDTYPTAGVSLSLKNSAMLKDMQYADEIEESTEEMPTYGSNKTNHTLVQLIYEEYDSELWDQLLDQLTFEEQVDLTLLGANQIAGAKHVSAPGGLVHDGPAGIRDAKGSVAYPGETVMACTYNTDLIAELGEAFGMEMQYMGYVGLYGPGANIHRNAYGGRNFEYYSEDGVLSGYMLDAELKGLCKMGIITYTKHFALNEQERNRYGGSVWANEQSIREIYLKAFQISVEDEECETVGIMTSFSRLGCTWSGAHKGLLTNVLRNEWGFKGSTMTDASVAGFMGEKGNTLALANAVCAGQTVWLGDLRSQGFGGYENNATVAKAIRQACKDNLWAQLHSSAVNGMKSGTRIEKITPWWIAAIHTAQVTVGIITGVCAAMAIASFVIAYLDKKKGVANNEKA